MDWGWMVSFFGGAGAMRSLKLWFRAAGCEVEHQACVHVQEELEENQPRETSGGQQFFFRV